MNGYIDSKQGLFLAVSPSKASHILIRTFYSHTINQTGLLNFWIELVLNVKLIFYIHYTITLNIDHPSPPKFYDLDIFLGSELTWFKVMHHVKVAPRQSQTDGPCSEVWISGMDQFLRSTLRNVSAVIIRPSLRRPRWPVWILWGSVCRSWIFSSLTKLHWNIICFDDSRSPHDAIVVSFQFFKSW